MSKSFLSSLFNLGGADFGKFEGIEFSLGLRVAESGVGGGGGGIGGVGSVEGVRGVGGVGGSGIEGIGDVESKGGGGGGEGGIGSIGFCPGVVEGKGTLEFGIF